MRDCSARPRDGRGVSRDVRRTGRPLPAARQLPGGPPPVIAHRTSPTNMGCACWATVAARDLGWLGTLETVDRLEATLATVGRLERFAGPFYNWYETIDLRPLRAPLRVHRGQRQPGRSPPGPGQRLSQLSSARCSITRPSPESRTPYCSCARRRAPSWMTGARKRSGSAIWTKPARPWSRRLRDPPRTAADWVARLGQLTGQADALVDIARTLTAERRRWRELGRPRLGAGDMRHHRESPARPSDG